MYIGINCDPKAHAEAATKPWHRVPPLRDGGDVLNMPAKGTRLPRDTSDIDDGDIYFSSAAKRHGNGSVKPKGFTGDTNAALAKDNVAIYITHREDSLNTGRDISVEQAATRIPSSCMWYKQPS